MWDHFQLVSSFRPGAVKYFFILILAYSAMVHKVLFLILGDSYVVWLERFVDSSAILFSRVYRSSCLPVSGGGGGGGGSVTSVCDDDAVARLLTEISSFGLALKAQFLVLGSGSTGNDNRGTVASNGVSIQVV